MRRRLAASLVALTAVRFAASAPRAARAQPAGPAWRIEAPCASEVELRARLGDGAPRHAVALTVGELAPGSWEAVVAVDGRSPRHLHGGGCAEVVEAALVVVILALDDGRPAAGGDVTGGLDEPRAIPVPEGPAVSLAVVPPPPPRPSPSRPVSPFVRIATMIDAGVLPSASSGQEALLGMRRGGRSVRVGVLALQGTSVVVLGSRVQVDLWAARAAACQDLRAMIACAGLEGGAAGVDAPTQRKVGSGRWSAVSFELGSSLRLSRTLRGFLEGSARIGLTRPRVQFDDGTAIFRSARFGLRLALGLELSIP